jgi:hypothetical protein
MQFSQRKRFQVVVWLHRRTHTASTAYWRAPSSGAHNSGGSSSSFSGATLAVTSSVNGRSSYACSLSASLILSAVLWCEASGVGLLRGLLCVSCEIALVLSAPRVRCFSSYTRHERSPCTSTLSLYGAPRLCNIFLSPLLSDGNCVLSLSLSLSLVWGDFHSLWCGARFQPEKWLLRTR